MMQQDAELLRVRFRRLLRLPTVIEEFLKFAAGESPFDFNKFIPYPRNSDVSTKSPRPGTGEHAGRPDYVLCARPKARLQFGRP